MLASWKIAPSFIHFLLCFGRISAFIIEFPHHCRCFRCHSRPCWNTVFMEKIFIVRQCRTGYSEQCQRPVQRSWALSVMGQNGATLFFFASNVLTICFQITLFIIVCCIFLLYFVFVRFNLIINRNPGDRGYRTGKHINVLKFSFNACFKSILSFKINSIVENLQNFIVSIWNRRQWTVRITAGTVNIFSMRFVKDSQIIQGRVKVLPHIWCEFPCLCC